MVAAVREAQRIIAERMHVGQAGDPVRVPELCRQRLLHYAESFAQLAQCLEPEKTGDRTGDPAGDAGQPEREDPAGAAVPSDKVCEAEEADISWDRQALLDRRRTEVNRILIGHHLLEMSQILLQLADALIQCRPMEERYRKLLRHAFRTESIYAEHFCYLTERDDTRAISMSLSTDREDVCPAAEAADMLSVLLKRRLTLSAASPVRIGHRPQSFVFVEEPAYVMLTGFCKVKKEGEALSGDHYSILESEKGRMTLLLSDGTGSGEDASRDSERALDLMEKFLEAGYDVRSAADMVNVAFFDGDREISHPTLDVCELNLYDGSCQFIKVGGAVSFIRHGQDVERIRQGSLPLGIFRNPEADTTEYTLGDGDYVILMTDGVPDAFSQDNYAEILEEYLSGLQEKSPGELAEKILEFALHACGGHVKDDMTVLVAGIWENTSVR